MARIEYIKLSLKRDEGENLANLENYEVIENVPQAYWLDGSPWHEANLWFLHLGRAVQLKMNAIATLHAYATSLKLYMVFLEKESVDWLCFPEKWSGNVLLRYRGYLIGLRQDGKLASSTTKRRMSDILLFYTWVMNERLLSPSRALFEDKTVVRYVDAYAGFKKALTIKVKSLSIPDARNRNGFEDGLRPVSKLQKERILEVARNSSSEELYLMLLVAFSSGLRLGSVCDLKEKTITNALRGVGENDLFAYLQVGPNVEGAPVKTKFDKEGRIIMPLIVLRKIKDYMISIRRIERQAKASPQNKNIIFLNRFGRPYVRGGNDKSSVINVEIFRLKKCAKLKGYDFRGFKFHRARATFASEVAATGLSAYGIDKIPMVIGLVRNLLMHTKEETSLAYISFVLEENLMSEWADLFFSKHVMTGASDRVL
ncbi:tyrosine-type recombinase/integrase [Pseudomonas sp. DSP3-2-2]|uniref:tyrosine-type recombinase/integrase n=1 Tax=unclassified Pseudomonas TaxID=196821 RepID=UPI003CF43B83